MSVHKGPHKKTQSESIRILRDLSIDEKLTILGSMMDAIAKLKIMLFVEATGCSEEDAINILRKRLIDLQERKR